MGESRPDGNHGPHGLDMVFQTFRSYVCIVRCQYAEICEGVGGPRMRVRNTISGTVREDG